MKLRHFQAHAAVHCRAKNRPHRLDRDMSSNHQASQVLLVASRDDPKRVVSKWPLQSASPIGAFIQRSVFSDFVKIAGMTLGWIARTTLFGSLVRKSEDVIGGLAFLHLSDGSPAGPYAC